MQHWIPADLPSRYPTRWLFLAIGALIAAGFLAILLVLSRTPAIQDIIPFQDFFHTALVVHVDLSVLIWFLAFASLFWSLSAGRHLAWLEGPAFTLIATGTLILLLSPFVGEGNPLMNNYVPVLQMPFFLFGLGMIGLGITLQALRGATSPAQTDIHPVISTAGRLSAATTLLALTGLGLSWQGIPTGLEGQAYYEFLFWGGGHILQFSHTLLLVAAWFWLLHDSRRIETPRWTGLLLLVAALPVLGAIPIYTNHEITDAGHRLGFTELMRYGGLAAAPAIALIAWQFLRNRHHAGSTPGCSSALFSSWILFFAGGVLGFMIQGVNVVIPAHYHGSIVGITLAYMGIAYLMLERAGYTIKLPRLARWQPFVYGGGQLMHILGLAWSGGYGVQRKTAGAAQGLDSIEKTIGMGMMGLGGMIAVIGGIMFLIVTLHAVRKRQG